MKKVSLRLRIFVSMIFMVLIASALIFGITIVQYTKQEENYHLERLEREENQLAHSIVSLYEQHHKGLDETLERFFAEDLDMISHIQEINFNVYSLNGELIASGIHNQEIIPVAERMPKEIFESIVSKLDRHVKETNINGIDYLSSYRYVIDDQGDPLCIIHLPYYQDDSFSRMELNKLLWRLALVYLALLIVGIVISYIISSYITRSFHTISKTLSETSLDGKFKKLEVKSATVEMDIFINAYNEMIDQLSESAAHIAKSEREQAWREMAKQVAHEIKNPLTPMRLNIQLFEQQFNPKDPKAIEELKEHTQALLQQIDTLSYIASAFSDFAQMPVQHNEEIDINQTINLAVSLFTKSYITYHAPTDEVFCKFDRTQLIRIINNLVKNAIQACDQNPDPKIDIYLIKNDTDFTIKVVDNGKGIPQENFEKIFEPQFTTKSSGMGLGLGMVKSIVETYNGVIKCESTLGVGTTIAIEVPMC